MTKLEQLGIDLGSGQDKTVIQCPNCKHGILELLSEREKKRLKEREGKDSYPDRIAGCDECRFWCDADEI